MQRKLDCQELWKRSIQLLRYNYKKEIKCRHFHGGEYLSCSFVLL